MNESMFKTINELEELNDWLQPTNQLILINLCSWGSRIGERMRVLQRINIREEEEEVKMQLF